MDKIVAIRKLSLICSCQPELDRLPIHVRSHQSGVAIVLHSDTTTLNFAMYHLEQ